MSEPRPSVWGTLGIALATALVTGIVLGAVLGGDDVPYAMGVFFGTLLIPALIVGGVWPFLFRKAPRWVIPIAVIVLGFLLRACTVAATMNTAP